MASSVVQVRVDENIKNEASEILQNLRLELSSAVRLFFNRIILCQGLPFSINLQNEEQIEEKHNGSLSNQELTFNPTEYLLSLSRSRIDSSENKKNSKD